MKFAKYSLFILTLFFIGARAANAAFEITEIMYDPSGTDSNREWVEVQNTGIDTLDLSKWYFFTDGTKHAIAPLGNAAVAPGAYAVIAQNPQKFKIDWPSYAGLLFDSSWTDLTNKGETIALKDPNLAIVSSVTFPSSSGTPDGYSLQKIGGSWIGSKPTPGEANKETPKIVEQPKTDTTVATSTTTAVKPTAKRKRSSGNAYTAPATSDTSEINLDSVGKNDTTDSVTISKSTLGWLSVILLIVLGSGGMLLYNRKKNNPNHNLVADDIHIEE